MRCCIYIGPRVTGVTVTATVHDASKVDVFDDGGDANVIGSTIYNIGNRVGSTLSPKGGANWNRRLLFMQCNATGTVSGNTIYNYQKGGIVVRDLDEVQVVSNTVTGLGSVNFIAQNGIEVGFGSCGPSVTVSNVGQITGNIVGGNIFTRGTEKHAISTGIPVKALADQNKGQLTSALETSNHVLDNQADAFLVFG